MRTLGSIYLDSEWESVRGRWMKRRGRRTSSRGARLAVCSCAAPFPSSLSPFARLAPLSASSASASQKESVKGAEFGPARLAPPAVSKETPCGGLDTPGGSDISPARTFRAGRQRRLGPALARASEGEVSNTGIRACFAEPLLQ